MAFWNNKPGFWSDKKGPVPVKVAKVRAQIDPTMNYQQTSGGLRPTYGDGFVPPEYDLAEIGRAEDCEAYVMQAHLKKTALMFKEGWTFYGQDDQYIKYIEKRISQVERAGSKSFWALLSELGRDLIRYSNAFLVKVRGVEDSQGRPVSGGVIRKTPEGRSIKPIAAYFLLSPETIEIRRSKANGQITHYRQVMPDGSKKIWPAENIIHFTFNKKGHFDVGTPTLIPVLDDIRALRKIEQNVEILIYQHLFPLYQYIVGTETSPARTLTDGLTEVDVVRNEIELLPSEGMIVTPERHEVKVIGAQGRALQVDNYLDHFKRRIIAGLSMSAVDFGEGDTSNRATADNMSRLLIDNVKFYQQVLSDQIQTHIIHELLLESTFGGDPLSADTMVGHRFREIDIDRKIKMENHAALMYQSQLITIDEARELMNRNPLLPEDEEKMHLARVDLKRMEAQTDLDIKVANEAPQPVVANVGDVGIEVGGKKKKATETKNMPKNQHGTKQGSEKRRSFVDKTMKTRFDDLGKDVIDVYERDGDYANENYVRQLVIGAAKQVKDDYAKRIKSAMARGAMDVGISRADARTMAEEKSGRMIVRLDSDVDRLFRQVNKMVSKVLASSSEDKSQELKQVFNSLRYRTKFIDATDLHRARNLGRAFGLKDQGHTEAVSRQNSEEDDICKEKDGTAVTLRGVRLDDVPPWHPNCRCDIVEAS